MRPGDANLEAGRNRGSVVKGPLRVLSAEGRTGVYVLVAKWKESVRDFGVRALNVAGRLAQIRETKLLRIKWRLSTLNYRICQTVQNRTEDAIGKKVAYALSIGTKITGLR